jgi:hypothetical protein
VMSSYRNSFYESKAQPKITKPPEQSFSLDQQIEMCGYSKIPTLPVPVQKRLYPTRTRTRGYGYGYSVCTRTRTRIPVPVMLNQCASLR